MVSFLDFVQPFFFRFGSSSIFESGICLMCFWISRDVGQGRFGFAFHFLHASTSTGIKQKAHFKSIDI